MAIAGASGWICAVCVFFVAGSVAQATNDTLAVENARLTAELRQRETEIRLLTESLAIARTESELFQKQWAEARLRAQALGADFTDAEATRAQRQLAESVRSLYLAEAERQRLAEQLRRLVAAVESAGSVTEEVSRAKELLAASEPAAGKQPAAGAKATGTLGAARVLDVNRQLRLVVLDVGAEQGARVGMAFVLTRGDREIARVRVVETRRRICGALIEKMQSNVTVTAGDAASVTKG